MKLISVMIVEDSRVVREFLEYIINRDPRLKIVASVGTGEEAMRVLPQTTPDVISLDIRLPGMNGLELTKRIMVEHPTPIVVVSSDVEDEELKISMNALRAGALSVVQKPVGLSHSDYDQMAESLCTKLVLMSAVKVIRQRYGTRSDAITIGDEAITPPVAAVKSSNKQPLILGMVASTGGPSALVRVLNDLGAEFPAPIVLVQHITPGFMRGFVSWLNEVVSQTVIAPINDGIMEPGKVYIAPAHCHLIVSEKGKLRLAAGTPVSLQRPSGTVLLRSLAEVYGKDSVGVVLTGMGDDGALGLKAMKEVGAYTLAEHASSAVVYGMPAAAVQLGAASEVLPLATMGRRISEIFSTKSVVS